MASIRKEFTVNCSPAEAWDAIRDVGALHTRLVPGFVVDTQMQPGARMVTFGNGTKALERIVDLDETARRLVWAISGTKLEHHNGAIQVFDTEESGKARLVWIADILPNELAGYVSGMMSDSVGAMQRRLDAMVTRSPPA